MISRQLQTLLYLPYTYMKLLIYRWFLIQYLCCKRSDLWHCGNKQPIPILTLNLVATFRFFAVHTYIYRGISSFIILMWMRMKMTIFFFWLQMELLLLRCFPRLISNLLKSGYGIHVSLHLQITFALIWPTSTIYSIQPFEQVLLDHHGECSSHKVNYVWNLNQFHFDYTLKTLQRDNMNDRAHMPTKYIRG